MQYGRIEIFTDAKDVNQKNIIKVLRDAYAQHQENASRYDFLLRYEAGEQPLQREKKYRPDINCECVDNIAAEATEFNVSYKWSNPITLVQRGKDESKISAISKLNDCYELQSIKAKTQKLGRFVEICGIGYTYIDTVPRNSDCPFAVEALDPRFTFVVRSNAFIDKRVVMGVTFSVTKAGKHFTCFTPTTRYEIRNIYDVENGKAIDTKGKWEEANRSGERNPLGYVPIIEWFRSYDRMGGFERQISEMDNLNLLISDFTNDVEQNTQAIWHTNDVEFPTQVVENEDGTKTEVVQKPKTNDWMQTFTSQDGKTPFVKPLAIDYNYEGMLNNIITRRALILQKCNVPQRNDNSGGSTGIAMSDATGWSAAEAAACKQQNIMESCKMEEVKVVLKAIQLAVGHEDLKKLTLSDVQPNIKRQKTYELTVKTNAITTLISHGFSLEDAITIAPLFEDPAQTMLRSGDGVKKYQESKVFGNEKNKESRPFADYSDQVENSPNING